MASRAPAAPDALWLVAQESIQRQLREFERDLRASLAAGREAVEAAGREEEDIYDPRHDAADPSMTLEDLVFQQEGHRPLVDDRRMAAEDLYLDNIVEDSIQRQLREFEDDLRADMLAMRNLAAEAGGMPDHQEFTDGLAEASCVRRISDAMDERLEGFEREILHADLAIREGVAQWPHASREVEESPWLGDAGGKAVELAREAVAAPPHCRLPAAAAPLPPLPPQPRHRHLAEGPGAPAAAAALAPQLAKEALGPAATLRRPRTAPGGPQPSAHDPRPEPPQPQGLARAGGELLAADRGTVEGFIQQQLSLFEEQLWTDLLLPHERSRGSQRPTWQASRSPGRPSHADVIFVREQLRAFERRLREAVYPVEQGRGASAGTIDKEAMGLVRSEPLSTEELIEKTVQDYETNLRLGALAEWSPQGEWRQLLGAEEEQPVAEEDWRRREEAALRIQSAQRGRAARRVAQGERRRREEDLRQLKAEKARREAEVREAERRELELAEEARQERQRLQLQRGSKREATLRRLQEIEEKRRANAAVKIQSIQRGRAARAEIDAKRWQLLEEEERRRSGAATAIQSVFQGRRARNNVLAERQRLQEEEEIESERRAKAVIKIQSSQRGRLARADANSKRRHLCEEAERRRAQRESVRQRALREREAEAFRLAEKQREREAAVRRVQLLEDKHRSKAATKIQSLFRGKIARNGAQTERWRLREEEEAEMAARRAARLEAQQLQRESRERARELVRREREAMEREAAVPSGAGRRGGPGCWCAGCMQGQGVDRVDQLRLLVKLGEDPCRCHRCDVGAVKLHALLRALGRVVESLHGGARLRRPPGGAAGALLDELAAALAQVEALDPRLGELAAHIPQDHAVLAQRMPQGNRAVPQNYPPACIS